MEEITKDILNDRELSSWYMPPVYAGQVQEIYFALDLESMEVISRCYDRSDRSITYMVLGTLLGEWAPWHSIPQVSETGLGSVAP